MLHHLLTTLMEILNTFLGSQYQLMLSIGFIKEPRGYQVRLQILRLQWLHFQLIFQTYRSSAH